MGPSISYVCEKAYTIKGKKAERAYFSHRLRVVFKTWFTIYHHIV